MQQTVNEPIPGTIFAPLKYAQLHKKQLTDYSQTNHILFLKITVISSNYIKRNIVSNSVVSKLPFNQGSK